MRRLAVLLLALLLVGSAAAEAQRTALPRSRLAVHAGAATRPERADGWRTWWRSDSAPARWTAARASVASQVRWRAASPGVEWGELALRGSGEAWRLRVVLVRIDPRVVRLRLHAVESEALFDGRWTVDSAPATAALALNAGQFRYGVPWGWVVMDGEEELEPRRGPLAMALAIDSSGATHWLDDGAIDSARAALRPEVAFQSYPALLVRDGEVPAPLRAPGWPIDLAHRDARLAIGELRDGRLLVALTRFDAAGARLGFVPFGPTVPEMAAIMGALGCRTAMLLDGGISSQLLLRERSGAIHKWRGIRGVPMGIIATPRE